MNELVERVAEALWRVDVPEDQYSWKEHTSDPSKRRHRELARAAIAGMRDLDEKLLMILAEGFYEGGDYLHMSDYHCLGRAWKTMIDVALKE